MHGSLDVESLRVVFIGQSVHTPVRQLTIGASHVAGCSSRNVPPGAAVESGTVCFLSLPGGQILTESLRLIRNGCHVFLDVPQMPSIADLGRLQRTADEAGVHVAVSRPLRYAPEIADLPGAADVISLESEFGESSDAWVHSLAETLDLCVYLSDSATARRVEASFDRRNRLWPVFGVFSIRFDNGSLAVCSLRQSAQPVAGTRCVTSRNADVQERVATLCEVAFRSETDDFLSRLAAGFPPRVSVADGLKGARLMDHLMSLLR